MDLIPWNENYNLGVPVLDAQHKYLTEIANRLFEALTLGEKGDDINNLLQKLTDGFTEHSKTEEDLLEKAGYEGLAEHKDVHKKYGQKLEDIKAAYKRLADPKIMTEELVFLKEIWTWHISETDRKFLPALKAKGLI